MKILIDKEKLEDELNKLGQQTSYDEWEQGRKTGKMEVLESILQQGEEYNENEAIEFAEWIGSFISLEFFNGIKEWEESNGKIIKRHTTQELFKLYKNARDTKKKK